MNEYLKLYNHILGNDYRLRLFGKNAKGYCPFCPEESTALSVSLETGKGQCFKCSTTVNPISFITKYHQVWLSHTPQEYYKELEEARGIDASIFEKAQFAWDANNEKWLVPYFNESTKFLRNLGSFRIDGDSAYKIFVLPKTHDNFPKGFYNPGTFSYLPTRKHKSVIVCEGEWDALALWNMLEMENIEEKNRPYILGSPGASIIPKGASNTLGKYKKVTLYYDNDTPGQEGMLKFASFLSAEGFKVATLSWKDFTEHKVDNFDIRDILTKTKEPKPYSLLHRHTKELEIETESDSQELGPGFISTVEGIPLIESREDYLNRYEEYMILTETNRKAIITTMATVAATPLPGEPIWLFLIGAASSGKTTLIESFGGSHEYCEYASKLTAKTLVSGWGACDASMLPEMNKKCFFVKDFTVILGMSKDQQKELFDLLRDIYDGSVKIQFGNGKIVNLKNLNFNLVAGVTPAIYKVKTSELGDRFLRLDYSGEDNIAEEATLAAIGNFGKTSNKKDDLTKASIGYLKFIKQNYWDANDLPPMKMVDKKILAQLATYVAYVRTNPEYHRSEGLLYRPKPEDPPRLGLQFTKLAYSLEKAINPTLSPQGSLVLTEETHELLAKIAYDTCYGFGQDILKSLYHNPKQTEAELSKRLAIQPTRVHRVLQDLKLTKMIKYSLRYGSGRASHLYYLDEEKMHLTRILYGEKE